MPSRMTETTLFSGKKENKKLFAAVAVWLKRPALRPKLLVVLGPTASGKTRLAIQLARQFNGEIVNADSRQIYRELKIGTARPTPAERRQAKHFLLARFSPQKVVSVAEYRELAEAEIQAITQRRCLPILAGGHSLLLSALVENYQFPQPADPDWHTRFDTLYTQKNGPEKLWRQLQKLEAELAAKISPRNKVHLARALERAVKKRRPQKAARKFEVFLIGLNPKRAELYAKIEQRVEAMLQQGFLAEVRSLAQKYPRFCPALRGHGYRELLDYLAGEKDLKTAVAEIKRDTRNYAKRQISWWRNSPLFKEIFWLEN